MDLKTALKMAIKRLLLKGQDDAFIKETLGVTDEDIRIAKQDLDC